MATLLNAITKGLNWFLLLLFGSLALVLFVSPTNPIIVGVEEGIESVSLCIKIMQWERSVRQSDPNFPSESLYQCLKQIHS